MLAPHQPPGVRANELLAALNTDQKIQLALGNFAALESFGVPVLKADDGPDGLRNPGTTALPSGQALAATFDSSLASAYGRVAGSEARGDHLAGPHHRDEPRRPPQARGDGREVPDGGHLADADLGTRLPHGPQVRLDVGQRRDLVVP